jgi:hypothetical protein
MLHASTSCTLLQFMRFDCLFYVYCASPLMPCRDLKIKLLMLPNTQNLRLRVIYPVLEHAVALRDNGVVCSICQHHASAQDMSLQQLAALAEEALQEHYTVAGATTSSSSSSSSLQ